MEETNLSYFLINSIISTPNLSFTYEISKSNVVFSDLIVSLRDGEIYINIYVKPTDGQQYLHYQYPIPSRWKSLNTIQSIIKS